MEERRLRRRMFKLSDGAYVVSLAGELDLAAVGELRETLDGLHASSLVLDLIDVTFVDSAGLGMIIRTSARVPTSVVTLNPHVLRFFRWTGADRRFDVHPTLADAVAALG
jgi:anti-sigma B factor antagonist